MHNLTKTPQHVAIIMDGNGRWAAGRKLPKIAGHRAGAKSVEAVITAARELGIKALTLYAFSTENWKRPKEEVSALFGLLSEYIDKEAARLNKNNIRVSVIGRTEELPVAVRDKLREVMELTKGNTALRLTLALNYGGRTEIVDAARAIARDVKEGRLDPAAIDEKTFAGYLYTRDLPDPDLMIRTSGEMRISNFLLWQLSYAELYVTKKLWPDFGKEDLKAALDDYRHRQRRYGG